MLGKMAKVIAYRNAPRAAASVFHPGASARIAHTKYDLRHGYAPRITAVGAALLAMPIGFMIGKMLTSRRQPPVMVASLDTHETPQTL